MTCKDCYHYEKCYFEALRTAHLTGRDYREIVCIDNQISCKFFKDKSLIVELPCKVGRFVYADTRLFCKDYLREEVRELDYICCDVVNVRYGRNMKALIYLRPLYRYDFNSRYHIIVSSSAIGKTVFLTEQEAKLKELKNEF